MSKYPGEQHLDNYLNKKAKSFNEYQKEAS